VKERGKSERESKQSNHALFLVRLMASTSLASVVVDVCNAASWQAGRPPGAWPVSWPTLHGGPVRLRPVRATHCFISIWTCSFSSNLDFGFYSFHFIDRGV